VTNSPTVSVIIIFLNVEKYLEEAIESVLAQAYPAWELLLVDDGSTDASPQIAKRYVERCPDRIRYLDHEGHENLGRSATRNLGIHNANGQYIAFLDADDVWLPEKLAYQVALMETRPEAGMVYGNTLYWSGWTGHPEDSRLDFMPELGVPSGTLALPPGLLPLFLEGKAAVPCTCSLLARTEAVRAIGGFEESIRGNYEDQAFYAKMCLVVPLLVSDRCHDWYRQHTESHTQVTVREGKAPQERLEFLTWLSDYLDKNHVEDPQLWLAIRRQMWLLGKQHQADFLMRNSKRSRWLRKWLLRLEQRTLPIRIRYWLWKV
jgi:glycosyltransferase involved in cell wall biosynthesis